MDLEPEDMQAVVRRLKRVQGQVGGIIAMLESGRDCTDVVTQVAAASKALDRAGFAIIAQGLQNCLTQEEGAEQELDLSRLEKLFLSLA